MTATAVIAIVALLGGGMSFAAEGSAPGDALYAIKTQVNEPIRGAFALSAESKANWNTRLTERRTEEAAVLAARGEVSEEVYDRLKTRFDEHANRTEEIVSRLEERGNAEAAAKVASNLEATLEAQERVLNQFQARIQATSTRAEIEQVEAHVRAQADRATQARARAEAGVTARSEAPNVEEAAENRIDTAQNFIAITKERIEARADQISEEAQAEVRADIEAAENLLAEAQTSFEAEAYAEAFTSASEAMRIARGSRVFIEGGVHAGVEVRGAPQGIFLQDQPGLDPQDEKGEDMEPSDPPSINEGGGERQACTMEAKRCPDGSYVGRTGPNCEFAQCPSGSGNSDDEVEWHIQGQFEQDGDSIDGDSSIDGSGTEAGAQGDAGVQFSY